MSEGSRHFDEQSAVFAALRKVTERLERLGIRYAVVGGMALFRLGFRRFTEAVDILVTKEGLRTIHERLEGLGYLPPHKHSKHLRDTELGVRIEFLTTGDYPGDGKPKPVAFPDPESVGLDLGGIRYINLPSLVELKLASGQTNAGRLKDLADVLEMIRLLDLPESFREQLHPYVREKFSELWRQGRKRYVRLWRSKPATTAAGSIEARAAEEQLEAMQRDGVVLEHDGDDARLVTTDPEVARKWDMVEETEFWDEGAEDDLQA